MTTTTIRERRAGTNRPAGVIGLTSFVLMFAVGSVYGMSGLQAALSSLEAIGPVAALLPFGAASLGLALGCGIAGTAISRFGARAVGVAGTLIWGASLAGAGAALLSPNAAVVTAVLGIGGVGVGLTYLTIVVTVGSAFPSMPIVGSAIGPFGFAAGTAAAMLVAANEFAGATAPALSTALIVAGLIVAVLAIVFGPGLPSRRNTPVMAESADAASVRRALRLVLFGNAYPGMLILAIAVPLLTTAPVPMSSTAAEISIALLTVALFIGGLLAPTLQRRIGAGRTFVLMLVIRAAILLAAVLIPSPSVIMVAIAVVLIGHGAGFSILPGIMRTHDDPRAFARNYAGVLVGWGVSGAVGAAIAMLSLATTGAFGVALVSATAVALLTTLIVVRCPPALFGNDR